MDACAVLLGPQARMGGYAFLQKLDVAVLRRAYRVLALATHPDVAWRSGARPGSADGRRFIAASSAYELLMAYLLSRSSRPAPASTASAARRPSAGQAKRSSSGASAHGTSASGARSRGDLLFYHGPIPRRRLRLAEFLYFTGRVSWQSLISALVWQRAARPRFGELARELRSITGQDLMKILASKLRHEQTGETAQRLRLLTEAEVARILRLQRVRHKPIGRYFVEKERMAGDALSGILQELYRHNARYRKAD